MKRVLRTYPRPQMKTGRADFEEEFRIVRENVNRIKPQKRDISYKTSVYHSHLDED